MSDPVQENASFTAKQLAYIEWLAIGKYERTPPRAGLLADQMGINESTLYRWKKIPGFMDAVMVRARELLVEDMPDIYASFKDEAKKGSFQHQKLAFEMTGEYSPKQEIEHSGEVKIKGYAKVSPDDWD